MNRVFFFFFFFYFLVFFVFFAFFVLTTHARPMSQEGTVQFCFAREE